MEESTSMDDILPKIHEYRQIRITGFCECGNGRDYTGHRIYTQILNDLAGKANNKMFQEFLVGANDLGGNMEGQVDNAGKKSDDGKPRMDLLSTIAMTEIAKVLTFGAKKYDSHNWRKGIAYSRIYAAIQRHLSAWNDGYDKDPETNLSHLAHAGCGLMFLLEYEKRNQSFDDRFKYDNTSIEEAMKKGDSYA